MIVPVRWETSDRKWRVDIISLSLTTVSMPSYGGSPGDGQSYRVTHNGFFVGDVRSVSELPALGVPLAELEER